MSVNIIRQCKFLAVMAGGLVMALGLSGTALGGCVQDKSVDPSLFNVLVDASSSCEALSDNMRGCRVDSSGSCTMVNPNTGETITVNLTAGSVGGSTPVNWYSTTTDVANPRAGEVDFAIIVGATGGGTCGWSYTPGSDFGAGLGFLKSNGSIQKMNDIYFCSDFIGPPPAVSRLVLTKTITKAGGVCGVDDSATLTVDTGVEVKYCYVVENVGIGDAENIRLIDDNATPGNPGDDFEVTLSPLNGTTLNSGATASGKSGVVAFTTPGQVVNTATVTADDGATSSASATLDVTQGLGTCPPAFQTAVDQQVEQTGEYPFAFLGDPKKPDLPAVCTPSSTNTAVASTSVTCIEGCAIKPECVDTPTAAGCSPQICQPSGVWTTVNDETGECGPAITDENSPLPFCWEVNQDLNRDCVLNGGEPMVSFGVEVKLVHSNPYVYQSCVKSRKGTVCSTTCYLYPGEDASVCPAGSVIGN